MKSSIEKKKIETVVKKCIRYIKRHKLIDFRVGKIDGCFYLIQKFKTPILINQGTDGKRIQFYSKVREKIEEIAIKIGIKVLRVRMKYSENDTTFYGTCVGTMAEEKINFNNMNELFSLPLRAANTLKRSELRTRRNSIDITDLNWLPIKRPKKIKRIIRCQKN